MPRRLIRVLLAALLIAAVPLQGFAAVEAAICRDLQHSQHDAGHAHVADAAQAHGAHGDSHATPGERDGTPTESKTAHCAACVSCGVVAGIVSAPAFSLPDAPGRDVIAHAMRVFVGFVPDGLDRPPLTHLA
ncbi:MAG: hypothetical protein R3357_15250 [Burkholderiales bacterium]|nr:hypothetical protein [Burkholderiales bacterium]